MNELSCRGFVGSRRGDVWSGSLGSRIKRARCAFTLLELLVAVAVLAVLMVMILSLTNIASTTWQRTDQQIRSFAEARNAFDRLTAALTQATLGVYWDYDNVNAPTTYVRASELQFLSLPMSMLGGNAARYPTMGVFFLAPGGSVTDRANFGQLPGLLNAYGYYIEFGPVDERPSFMAAPVGGAQRYRLKEWKLPAEEVPLYSRTSGTGGSAYMGSTSTNWIDVSSFSHTIADNVVALVINPVANLSGVAEQPLTTNFVYNSRNDGASPLDRIQRHQLPPELEVVMVAITEQTAQRLEDSPGGGQGVLPAGLFSNPTQLDSDLESLRDTFDADERIEYVILRSKVKLRTGPWSETQ